MSSPESFAGRAFQRRFIVLLTSLSFATASGALAQQPASPLATSAPPAVDRQAAPPAASPAPAASVPATVAGGPASASVPPASAPMATGTAPAASAPVGPAPAASAPAASAPAASAPAAPAPAPSEPAPPPAARAAVPTSPISSTPPPARSTFDSRSPTSTSTLSSTPFGNGQLPRTHGQIWRTYDLSRYVDPIRNVAQPEQAALDWILRETGSDVWFGQPFGFLSVDRKAVHVYHTPEMHQTVQGVVDRLNASKGESYDVALRAMTVGSPNWRSRAFATLQPVPVQTPGVEAWLLTRENATLLIEELKRRLDVTEFEASVTPVVNGQSLVRDVRRPKQYVKTVAPAPGSPSPYAVVPGSVDEGYQIQISPLIGEGGRVVDAVIRWRVEQVEKLIDVPLEIPLPAGGTQSVTVQVPQVASSQMHERFRWPAEGVLLISGGVGAAPGDEANKNLLGLPTGLLEQAPPRADGLLFVEIRGRTSEAAPATARTAESWSVSGGRY